MGRYDNDIDEIFIRTRPNDIVTKILLCLAGAFLVGPALYLYINFENQAYFVKSPPRCIRQEEPTYIFNNNNNNNSNISRLIQLREQMKLIQQKLSNLENKYQDITNRSRLEGVASQSEVENDVYDRWSYKEYWKSDLKTGSFSLFSNSLYPVITYPSAYFLSNDSYTIHYKRDIPLGDKTDKFDTKLFIFQHLKETKELINRIKLAIKKEIGGDYILNNIINKDDMNCINNGNKINNKNCQNDLVGRILAALIHDKPNNGHLKPHRITIASIGHKEHNGVLMNETYIHVTQQLLAPILSSLGIQIAARDFSGVKRESLLSCWNSILGESIDLISINAEPGEDYQPFLAPIMNSISKPYTIIFGESSFKWEKLPKSLHDLLGIVKTNSILNNKIDWSCDIIKKEKILNTLKCDCLQDKTKKENCNNNIYSLSDYPVTLTTKNSLGEWLPLHLRSKLSQNNNCNKLYNGAGRMLHRIQGIKLAWYIIKSIEQALSLYEEKINKTIIDNKKKTIDNIHDWELIHRPLNYSLNDNDLKLLCSGTDLNYCLISNLTCYTSLLSSSHPIEKLLIFKESPTITPNLLIKPNNDEIKCHNNRLNHFEVTTQVTSCKGICITLNLKDANPSRPIYIELTTSDKPIHWSINNQDVKSIEIIPNQLYKINMPNKIFDNILLRIKDLQSKTSINIRQIYFQQGGDIILPPPSSPPPKVSNSTASERKWLYPNINRKNFEWLNKKVEPVFRHNTSRGRPYYVDEYGYTVRVAKSSILNINNATKNNKENVLKEINNAQNKINDLIQRIQLEYSNSSFFQINNPKEGMFCSAKTPNCYENLKKHLLTKILWDEPTERWPTPHQYKIAMTGHSAGAAHGNYAHDAYSMVFTHILGEGLAEVGVKTAGLNFCSGGTASVPLPIYCINNILGPSVDWVGWDFDMTEGGSRSVYVPNFMRSISSHSSQPPLVYFHSFNEWANMRINEFPLINVMLSGSSRARPGVPSKLPSCEKRKNIPWLHWCECKNITTKEECDVGYAPYWPWTFGTDNPLGDILPYYKPKLPRNERHCFGRAGWHPQAYIHKFYGNQLAHFHLKALSDALTLYRDYINKNGIDKLKEWNLAKPLPKVITNIMPLKPLPSEFCPNNICIALKNLECRSQAEPRAMDGLESILIKPIPELVVERGQVGAFHAEYTAPCEQYSFDVKWTMILRAKDGVAQYKLENIQLDNGFILIGEPAQGWTRTKEMVDASDNKSVQVKVNDKIVKIERAVFQRQGTMYLIKTDKSMGTKSTAILSMSISKTINPSFYFAITSISWTKTS